MGNKNDNIQLFILEQMRKRNTPSQKLKDVTPKMPEQPRIIFGDQTTQAPINVLKEINKEEKALQNEREELIRTRQTMQLRLAEQIEFRKHRIEQHKAEITYLKQKCAVLQNVLEPPIDSIYSFLLSHLQDAP
jgi:predicted transcriptional regulator